VEAVIPFKKTCHLPRSSNPVDAALGCRENGSRQNNSFERPAKVQFIEPMYVLAIQKLPNGPDWLYDFAPPVTQLNAAGG
jgi:hypothetical protein